jgi:uncharacterized protein
MRPSACQSSGRRERRAMRRFIIAVLACSVLGVCAPARAAAPAVTPTGIPLDAPWKATIYAFARGHFHHPAWGWQHSERDYRLAVQIARGDGLPVDTDVLFAAAMMHDMAAFKPWENPKIEHGDIAALASEPILRKAGFPMAKFPAVQAAMRTHMFYSTVGKVPEAIALHDADSIDFLGAMGALRIIALTGEDKPSTAGAIKTLREFVHTIPSRLLTKTARAMSVARVAELTHFLDAIQTESYGKAL